MGLKVAVMGDVIREEAARLGLSPSDDNLGQVGNMLREKEGPEAVARRTLRAVLETNYGISPGADIGMDIGTDKGPDKGPDIIVVDGLRSKSEADYFRCNADEFHLVEIIAPVEARVKWIESRGRPDDPKAIKSEKDPKVIASCKDSGIVKAETLERRECRELSWGMCEAMREADLRLQNVGNLEEFRASVRRLLEDLIRN
jgi:hypothetical protein